jgi:mono/diheme cytochrome c family protein
MRQLVLFLAAIAALACSSSTSTPTTPPASTTATVERGAYLVNHVLVCGLCHTPNGPDGKPDMSKYLAGGRSYDFTDASGTVVRLYAENLTSDDPEGLFNWTDDAIRTALTKGIDDEHVAIYPIMPYPEYSLLTLDDVNSVIKYLRTVPSNANVVPNDFPYQDQFPPAPPVEDSKVPHTTLATSDPDFAAAERGRYLATAACLNCHTEQITDDVPDLAKAFGGGKKYTFDIGAPQQTSVNITPDPTGIGSWSIDDIISALKTNKEKGTQREFCNSHPGGPELYGKMTDGDLRDIATYVHTLPPVTNGPFKCVQ